MLCPPSQAVQQGSIGSEYYFRSSPVRFESMRFLLERAIAGVVHFAEVVLTPRRLLQPLRLEQLSSRVPMASATGARCIKPRWHQLKPTDTEERRGTLIRILSP